MAKLPSLPDCALKPPKRRVAPWSGSPVAESYTLPVSCPPGSGGGCTVQLESRNAAARAAGRKTDFFGIRLSRNVSALLIAEGVR
jgi:hypothetical protein